MAGKIGRPKNKVKKENLCLSIKSDTTETFHAYVKRTGLQQGDLAGKILDYFFGLDFSIQQNVLFPQPQESNEKDK